MSGAETSWRYGTNGTAEYKALSRPIKRTQASLSPIVMSLPANIIGAAGRTETAPLRSAPVTAVEGLLRTRVGMTGPAAFVPTKLINTSYVGRQHAQEKRRQAVREQRLVRRGSGLHVSRDGLPPA